MARTPLMRALRRLVSEQHAAATSGRLVEEIREERATGARPEGPDGSGWSRRRFLGAGAAVAAASMLPGRLIRAASGAPRIAVVGGGIAGLTAALTLRDAGYAATIYEAMDTIGGRLRSERGVPLEPGCGTCHAVSKPIDATWDQGQVTDIFGELIDSGHLTMHQLAARYGLPMIDLLANEPAGATETYHFLGSYYPKSQADADLAALYPTIRADLSAAGYPTTYDHSKPGGRALDNMSIYDWIETRVPGGHASPMGRLLDVAYNIEFGAETADQSALSLLYLLGYSPSRREFFVFGESDERYHVEGGVDRVPRAIADDLGYETIRLGWFLESLALRSDGTYELDFGREGVVTADIVVMTAPFAAMSNIDLSQAGFDARKHLAIESLGKGHNGKHHIQFTHRLWNQPGPWGVSGGSSYADTGYQVAWDATRGQPGQAGILAVYTGGDVTDAQAIRHPYGTIDDFRVRIDNERFLSQLEPVFPGLTSRWNGRAAGSMAHLNPFWNCSYSYWRVGQYQAFAGYERVRQGNVFFAGEHTSVDFQGWMEGAALEGVRAGNEILASFRGRGK